MNKQRLKRTLIVIGVIVLIIGIPIMKMRKASWERKAFLEHYWAYSPRACPNTKWTCAERDIYFYSDDKGKTLGVVDTGEGPKFFSITFVTEVHRGISGRIWVAETKGLLNKTGPRDFMFAAQVDYYEDHCVISYSGNDEDEFWGPCDEPVVLTFWKEELDEPFYYDD